MLKLRLLRILKNPHLLTSLGFYPGKTHKFQLVFGFHFLCISRVETTLKYLTQMSHVTFRSKLSIPGPVLWFVRDHHQPLVDHAPLVDLYNKFSPWQIRLEPYPQRISESNYLNTVPNQKINN